MEPWKIYATKPLGKPRNTLQVEDYEGYPVVSVRFDKIESGLVALVKERKLQDEIADSSSIRLETSDAVEVVDDSKTYVAEYSIGMKNLTKLLEMMGYKAKG